MSAGQRERVAAGAGSKHEDRECAAVLGIPQRGRSAEALAMDKEEGARLCSVQSSAIAGRTEAGRRPGDRAGSEGSWRNDPAGSWRRE